MSILYSVRVHQRSGKPRIAMLCSPTVIYDPYLLLEISLNYICLPGQKRPELALGLVEPNGEAS